MIKFKHSALTVLLVLVGHLYAYAYDVNINGIYYDFKKSGHYVTDLETGKSVYVVDSCAYVTHDNNYVDVNPDPTSTNMQLKGGHYSGDIKIPSSIEYKGNRYSVVGIARRAFYKCNELQSVSLPDTITYIENEAFRNCSSLTSITLPKALTNIESYVFYECSNLKNINIPDSLKNINIGRSAFSGCSSLEKIVLPEGLQYIAEYLFNNCSSLKEVKIPSSIISLRSGAFNGCNSLNSITIPKNSSISFENNAFYGYNGLIYNLSDMKIDSYSHVFTEKFDSGDFIYGKKKSEGDLYLTEYIAENDTLVLPDDYNGNDYKIYSNAKIKKTITSLNTGNGITELPKGIFSNFSALNEVTIGKSLVSAGSGVFAGCKNIKTLNYNAIKLDNKDTNDSWGWTDDDGNYYSGYSPLNFPLITTLNFGKDVEIIPNNMVQNNKYLETVIFADSIKADAIGDKTFYYCQNLQTIQLGEHDGLKLIGEQAFYNCSKLNAVNLKNIETIGAQAFYNCSKLETLNLENIKEIVRSAFYGCTDLKEVTIGKNLVSAGSGVFAGCKNIKTLNYNAISFDNKDTNDSWGWKDTNGNYYSGKSPLNFPLITTLKFGKDVEIIPNNMVQNNKYLETVIFADSIKADTIGDKTFYYCQNLEKIQLGEHYGLKFIGEQAFYNCSKLNVVNLENIETIGAQAFYNCSKLEALNLENIKEIGRSAFYGCTDLKEVTIGKNLLSAGSGVFAGCKNIKTLNYNAIKLDNKDTNDSWGWKDDNGNYYSGKSPLNFPLITTLNFGRDVEIIPNNMVRNNKNLETVIFADSIKAQTIDEQTFYNCINLKSINLYEETKEMTESVCIKNIGNNAFAYCSNLTSLDLRGVKTIGDNAFAYCSNLTSLDLRDVATIGDYAFEYCSNLTSLDLRGAKTIGDYAFAYCPNLTSLDLRGAETIGDYAFGGIRISNLTLGKKLSSVSNNAFSFNNPLNKLTVGNNYGLNYMLSKEYYDSNNNYKSTRIIRNLVIAEDFAEASLTDNLSNQNLLETIESKTVAPLAFAKASPFTDEQYGSILVVVPEDSKEAYKAARIWKLFNITSGDCVVKLYNGNSDKLMIAQNGTERPEAATEKNAVIFVDEQLEADSELLNMGNVIYRDGQDEWVANEITLVDAQPFYTPTDAMANSITYKRNFTSTNLQALYLPYAMSYDDWKDKAKVSYINDVHNFDDDDDGEIDRTVLEFISVKSGDLEPNTPYLIKPLEKGEVTFTSNNKTLKATLSDGYVDCSSTRMLYTLKGTYQTRDDIYANGYYVMDEGTFKQADNDEVNLSPFRILLSITNRYDNGAMPRAKKITIMVDGIEEETTTNIDNIIINDTMPTENYNLQGIRVGESYKGIVIKNGRKVLVK